MMRQTGTAVILAFVAMACAHVPVPMPAWAKQGTGAFDGAHPCFRGVGVASHFHEDELRQSAAQIRARAELAKTLDSVMAAILKEGDALVPTSQHPHTGDAAYALTAFVGEQFTYARTTDLWTSDDESAEYALSELDYEPFKAAFLKWTGAPESRRAEIGARLDAIFAKLVDETKARQPALSPPAAAGTDGATKQPGERPRSRE